MPAYGLLINGIPVSTTFRDEWSITAPQNGAATLEATLTADAVGDLFAASNEEIVVTENGVPIFGGNIVQPKLAGIGGKGTIPVNLTLSAKDFNNLASRRYIGAGAANFGAATVKQLLQVIVMWIRGVTLADDQLDGPTVEAFDASLWRPQEALDYITEATGWIWRIDVTLLEPSLDPMAPYLTRTLRMFEPGTLVAPYDVDQDNTEIALEASALGVAIGDVTVTIHDEDYYNRVFVVASDGSLLATAEDLDAIGSTGESETKVQAPDGTTTLAAAVLGAQVLATSLVVYKEIQYTSLLAGLQPGQSQHIRLPFRGIDNLFLVTEINTQFSGGIARRTVTAIEGSVYKAGWRDKTRSMFGSSNTSFVGSGGGGGSSSMRYAYPLGGAEGVFVSSPVPTWVDAAPNAVQVDTVARGTRNATIVAQLRALTPGVSVRARLFDVTDNIALPGVSALVVDTEWQTKVWTTTLAAGAHFVKVQVLPGTANEGVAFTGYLE